MRSDEGEGKTNWEERWDENKNSRWGMGDEDVRKRRKISNWEEMREAGNKNWEDGWDKNKSRWVMEIGEIEGKYKTINIRMREREIKIERRDGMRIKVDGVWRMEMGEKKKEKKEGWSQNEKRWGRGVIFLCNNKPYLSIYKKKVNGV